MLVNILEEIKNTRGTNAKKEILLRNRSNEVFLRLIRYALDPFMPFNVVKVPRTKQRFEGLLTEAESWDEFFITADRCAKRHITGNSAVEALSIVFSHSSLVQEAWMRRILKKHLAIGVSEKTVNSVIPNLIPTFNIALAQKFDIKRIKSEMIAIEPKLDGIRCFAIVKKGTATIYARSGKVISNFDSTIGEELSQLGDGCYDGEIMGEDFTSLMRQAYRKESINLDGTYLALFDFVSLKEWESKSAVMSCFSRYDELIYRVTGKEPETTGMGLNYKVRRKYLRVVKREYIRPDMTTIQSIHDAYVTEGYEGVMIKDIEAPYKFGRGFEVMKFKSFHDVDLSVKALLEGTGKHSGKLGSFVVCYKGVDVQVGSGLTDDLREAIWNDKDRFIGKTIEVRYQEVTPDGSLRFPTFVCFRNDR